MNFANIKTKASAFANKTMAAAQSLVDTPEKRGTAVGVAVTAGVVAAFAIGRATAPIRVVLLTPVP